MNFLDSVYSGLFDRSLIELMSYLILMVDGIGTHANDNNVIYSVLCLSR